MPILFGLSCREFMSPAIVCHPHSLGVHLTLERPYIRPTWQSHYPHWQLTLDNPAQKAVSLLGLRGLTLATAESCTGGAIASSITDIPGASKVLVGGVVAYTPYTKSRLLGLNSNLPQGCVEPGLTEEMAGAVRASLDADMAVAITGALGPTSPVRAVPVGTVYIAVCGFGKSVVRKFIFSGDRETIKKVAVEASLNFVLTFFARWYIA